MRKYYLDNIRWAAVVIVVLYHVFYMYNAEGIVGVVGKIEVDLRHGHFVGVNIVLVLGQGDHAVV